MLGRAFKVWCLLIVLGALDVTGATRCLAADRALIIAVDKYPRLPERLQLTGAVNDARAMAKLASVVWGFSSDSIKLLLDQDATSSSIPAAIESWLIAGSSPGDRVLLTYSGHGYFQRSADSTEPTGFDQTLAPSDVARADAVYVNMISDNHIARLLRRLEGREVMLIIDSCHSGTITRALEPRSRQGPSVVRSLTADGLTRSLGDSDFDRVRLQGAFAAGHPHVMAWTAVASTELAEEDMSLPGDRRLGVFTRAFVEGLLDRRADTNGNGAVSPFELIHYLRNRASAYCDDNRCRTRMTPTLEWPRTFSASDLLDWRGTNGGGERRKSKPDGAAAASTSFAAQDVILQSNARVVRVELLPGPKVRRGQKIKIRITSPEAGFLIVLDVREEGRVVQLFPSKCSHKERWLRAGEPLSMPDGTYGCVFEATEVGKGQILAIVTGDRLPIEDLLDRNRDLSILVDGTDFLAEIARKLLSVWTGGARNRPVQWRLGVAGYEVGP